MLLAGDIGGTKTNLAFFEDEGEKELVALEEKTFSSQEFSQFDELLLEYLSNFDHKVTSACFSVAGPVINGSCNTTNLPWSIESDVLTSKLGFKTTWLINDLEANAHGITHLSQDEYEVLHEGKPGMHGNACVISAGTGLGEAGMFWNGDGYIPFACEGGHTDFAPRGDEQIELLKYIRRDHNHVSYERVLSGMGLSNIYQFLRDTHRCEEPEWLAQELAMEDDQAKAISRFAFENKAEICVKALDMFVQIYGAEAGNAALKFMAFGGVFIGGGIAPKIIEKMKEPTFMDCFMDKGRMSSLMDYMPVKVIMNSRTALFGAARFALLKTGKLTANVSV